MIRWCSYCQHYQGEIEPLEDYAITHGICRSCRQALTERRLDAGFLDRVRTLGARMMAVLYDGETVDVEEVLAAGRDIGLRPVDLAMGILQPSLYKVGKLWESGDIAVEDEHRFTHFAQMLFDGIYAQVPAGLIHAKRPVALLVQADSNAHSLGLLIVALHLASEEIPSRLFPAATGRDELMADIDASQPAMLGISVSMIDQISEVEEVATDLRARFGGSSPEIVIGGYPLRNGYRPNLPRGITVARDTQGFVAHCRALSAGHPAG